MAPRKRQRAILAKIREHPTQVTTADIRAYGNVSKLRIMFEGMNLYLIPYLAARGHKFGYESVDDPVSSDPDNILNVLIAAAATNPDSQEPFSSDIHDIFNDYPVPWQVMVRLAQAYRDGELPFIGGSFDEDELLYYLYISLDEQTQNHMNLFHALLNNFELPLNSRIDMYTQNRVIHMAVMKNNREAVKLLLEAGADPNIRGDDGKTACELAADVEMQNLVCPPILGANAAPVRQHLGVKGVKALAGRQGLSRRLKALALLLPQAAAGAGGQGQPGYLGGGTKKLKNRTRRRRLTHRHTK